MKYAYLFLAVAFNVASYVVYRRISARESNALWYVLFGCGLLLGAINTFCFTKALKDIELSIAYPVFSGACIFFTVLSAYVFFGERMSAMNMAGAVVVALGIAMMSN